MTNPYEHRPDIPANELQHVELWKYFESRGASVKDTMFNVVTWIVGFAAVILGFIIKETISLETDSLVVSKPFTLFVLSAAGMLVVVYARVLIGDFGDHINRNFDRADRARDKSKSLLEILDIDQVDPNKTVVPPKICKYILRVVWAFGIVFLLGVLVAVVKFISRAPC